METNDDASENKNQNVLRKYGNDMKKTFRKTIFVVCEHVFSNTCLKQDNFCVCEHVVVKKLLNENHVFVSEHVFSNNT